MTALDNLRELLRGGNRMPGDSEAAAAVKGKALATVTWRDLRAVEAEARAEERSELRQWLTTQVRLAEEAVVMAPSDAGSVFAAQQMASFGRVIKHLDEVAR